MFRGVMRRDRIAALSLILFALGCQKAENHDDQKVVDTSKGTGPAALAKPHTEQVPPPFDLKTPPADAAKTASGLVYKKEVTNDAGAAPTRNDTVMINYTGWRPSTGETFYTNRARGQPMPLNLSTTAPGFTEGLQLLKKGEKAVFWIPPSIGYKGSAQGTPETLVYEFELVDIQAAPPAPPDVAKPPANAEATKSGIKFVVVRPGTGKDKAKSYDNVTFNYTAWDAEGRMFDTTEMMRKKAAKSAPYRQASAFEDILTNMIAGERVRFWVDSQKMQQDNKPVPGMPNGQLCYEAEIVQIEPGVAPPTTPPDVAKPPGDAKKTAKGVFYKVLKPGKGGPHPTPTDTVRVHYSGWTTDGKMFDSSVVRNEPSEFGLQGVIAGWTDGIPQMSVGDKFRFWIPEELAYKGQPGRPQGMLVFDVELLEIKQSKAPPHPPMGPHHP
jgi:FKBP-type peptidyl-prolyl cis-trans isomerase